MLKARYFRRCSFLDATIGNNPSFIWLSILWGRELLQRGIRWCVGSGQHIRIYGDNWVPMPLLFRPISPKNLGNEARVADLIENGNSWNMTLLRKYFLPPDIHSIMKIKLPSQSCNDRVIWYYDRCGEYTVKSGYHIARTWKNLDSAASSSVSSWQWATIWKLIAPSKVKIFLWRAFSGSLPSIENLELKRVVDDSRCRICGEAGESILHALFVCQHAHDVWELTSFTITEFLNRVACLWDVWDIVYSKVAFNEIQLFVLIMWGISRARNRILYDGGQAIS